MIDNDFIHSLELKVSELFSHEKDKELKSFWCDGISLPENEYNLKPETVERTSQLEFKMWSGKSGQDIYKLLIKLNDNQVKKYIKGEKIVDDLKSMSLQNPVIDFQKRIFEFELND